MSAITLSPLRQLPNPPYHWLHQLLAASHPHVQELQAMYTYDKIRPQLFTEEGQRVFLKIRDNVHRLCAEAGCVRALEAWKGCSGDSWLMIACIDRLVELNEIHELTGESVMAQYRVFVRARES
jgi:hypothetical protein